MASPLFDVPVSPWTERFGTYEDVSFPLIKKGDGLCHSELAPLHPRLHPKYYDSIPLPNEFVKSASDTEIDDILIAEEFQRTIFFGNPSWRIPPFNGDLSWDEAPSMSGGHRPGDDQRYPQLLQDYMAKRITVDESTWLPFFRKDRWYDFDQGFSNTIVEADGTTQKIRTWSVDNDQVWNTLRFTIEIANRILKALLRDNNRWLGMLLYGRVQLWYELYSDPIDYHKYIGKKEYRILMDPETEKQICQARQRPFLGRDIEPSGDKRRDLMTHLLNDIVWMFLSSADRQRGLTNICTGINPNLLVLLCGGTISIAERCILHVNQAVTVNELMHALFKKRVDDGVNISPEVLRQMSTCSPNCNQEPYIENEPIREVGRSFEAAVFGGTPIGLPYSIGSKYTPNIPMLVAIITYPSLYAVSHLAPETIDHPSLQSSAPVEISLLPAALFWRLQSEDFWNLTPPHGQNGFLYPKIFTTKVAEDIYTDRILENHVTVNPDAARGIRFRDMAQRWNERLSIWSARRPWYDSALRRWLETPWGYMKIRKVILIFIEGYKARDEAKCASIAWALEAAIPRVNLDTLPKDIATSIPEVGSNNGSPHLWLFHCLALLMFAALPLRKVDRPGRMADKVRTLQRSKTVGDQFPPFIRLIDQAQEVSGIARRDLYFHRLTDARTVRMRSREHYIFAALDTWDYFARDRGIHTYKAFDNAILNLTSYIHLQIRSQGFTEESWLPQFPFEIPTYQPSLLSKWNPSTQVWDDVTYKAAIQARFLDKIELR
ncbi:hypothetical protein F5Y12DRAFT_798360 [Xylaria sp. FL1777]|nr:hypothetical protein F5Y12DRAFT_798360 [Xylaria sp. FL1777]